MFTLYMWCSIIYFMYSISIHVMFFKFSTITWSFIFIPFVFLMLCSIFYYFFTSIYVMLFIYLYICYRSCYSSFLYCYWYYNTISYNACILNMKHYICFMKTGHLILRPKTPPLLSKIKIFYLHKINFVDKILSKYIHVWSCFEWFIATNIMMKSKFNFDS